MFVEQPLGKIAEPIGLAMGFAVAWPLSGRASNETSVPRDFAIARRDYGRISFRMKAGLKDSVCL